METIQVLAINPGSTSTKIAVYHDTSPVFIQTIRHTSEELSPFERVTDQYTFRKDLILQQLLDADIDLNSLSIIMGRGGLLKPVESGVIEVNEKMIHDLKSCKYGEHASNLGGILAYDIAQSIPNASAYISNPVVVDELNGWIVGNTISNPPKGIILNTTDGGEKWHIQNTPQDKLYSVFMNILSTQ